MGLPLTPAKIIADFCKFSLFVDKDIGELQPQIIRGRRLIQAASSLFKGHPLGLPICKTGSFRTGTAPNFIRFQLRPIRIEGTLVRPKKRGILASIFVNPGLDADRQMGYGFCSETIVFRSGLIDYACCTGLLPDDFCRVSNATVEGYAEYPMLVEAALTRESPLGTYLRLCS
jgi:hypothetical protein